MTSTGDKLLCLVKLILQRKNIGIYKREININGIDYIISLGENTTITQIVSSFHKVILNNDIYKTSYDLIYNFGDKVYIKVNHNMMISFKNRISEIPYYINNSEDELLVELSIPDQYIGSYNLYKEIKSLVEIIDLTIEVEHIDILLEIFRDDQYWN